jgi:hypothetical protein
VGIKNRGYHTGAAHLTVFGNPDVQKVSPANTNLLILHPYEKK